MERFSYCKLYHSGIFGQKWGVRRFQYLDGTLTPEGRRRYGRGNSVQKYLHENDTKRIKSTSRSQLSQMTDEEIEKAKKRKELEKSLIDKDTELNKSIGENAVPQYLNRLKEINLASKEIRDIISNTADISNNLVRTLNPAFNYKELYAPNEIKTQIKTDANGNITSTDTNSTRKEYKKPKLYI